MWLIARLLLVYIYAQETFGQPHVAGLRGAEHIDNLGDLDRTGDYAVAFNEGIGERSIAEEYTKRGTSVFRAQEHGLKVSGARAYPVLRELQQDDGGLRVTMELTLPGCIGENLPAQTITVWFLPPGSPTDNLTGWRGVVNIDSVVFDAGKATVTFDEDEIYDSAGAKADFCEDCVVIALGSNIECADGEISTSNVQVSVKGDPHMVGLLGQKIDWVGQDNMWYCLLHDGPGFQINVRLTAPMKEEFPNRQLVSAISLLSNDGHSLMIEVNDPYSAHTNGCPKDSSAPCLADGGVRILVDGKTPGTMLSLGERSHLPGGVVLSAANLAPECRPFGGDRIWAAQFEAMMTNRRSLRAVPPVMPFNEWILKGETLAAPTWCAKLLEEVGTVRPLSVSTNHMTARIETTIATIRVNVGVNYQDVVTGPDGTVLVPELEFWQTDLGFDIFGHSDRVTGLLGDTSTHMLDDNRLPIISGLGALHAPVESYLVDGPFGRVFEKRPQ